MSRAHPPYRTLDVRVRALVELGELLRDAGYEFVTVTPETHRTVLGRDGRRARTLRDAFGWNREFALELVGDAIELAMRNAGVLVATADGFRSAVRFATMDDAIFVHSAFPTRDADAVFFGPDTYRFISFLAREGVHAQHAVDVGTGSGAGGIFASKFAERATLADINPCALVHAQINATLASVRNVTFVESDVLASVEGEIDLIVSNPPFLRDPLHRTYRDGGGDHGEHLSVRIASESIARLSPGGRLLLYTGACIVEGRDTFFDAVSPRLAGMRSVRYEVIDPDIFGETLGEDAYADADRIAAVTLVVTKD